MDAGLWIVLGLVVGTIVLLWIGAAEAERRWQRNHPPDGWDGMREERFDDDQSE